MTDRPHIVRRLLADKANLAADLVDPALAGLHRGLMDQMARNSRTTLPTAEEVEATRRKWLLSLQVSEDYAIAERIQPLLDHAAADLPDDFVIEHHHLHAEHGFLWFERKITDEVQGPSIRVLTWHAGQGWSPRTKSVVPGLEVNVWATLQVPPDQRYPAGEHLMPVGADFVPWGMTSNGWADLEFVSYDRNLSNAIRQVLAFQTFAKMELPAMTRWPTPKSQIKPLARVNLPSGEITVIDLRHRKPSARNEGSETDRTVGVQFIVRGHWHAYWVGPGHPLHSGHDNGKEKVHIYVHPFWKGPEDGPLAITQRVHVARR